jgi:hypothetical protein
MPNLLVVDFDWFFPNPLEARSTDMAAVGLYDWGHRESTFHLSNMLWSTRAVAFLASDLPLPGVTVPDGGWAAFWSRFTFTPNARMEYADSNAYAGNMQPTDGSDEWATVHLYDAHHDSGYNIPSVREFVDAGTFSCEDWMIVHYLNGCTDLTVHYPTWKQRGPQERIPDGMPTKQVLDDGQPLDTVFDAVFICRSGAWVPSWCDRDFLDLLTACPVPGRQVDDLPMDREFDTAEAEALLVIEQQQRALLRQMNAHLHPPAST